MDDAQAQAAIRVAIEAWEAMPPAVLRKLGISPAERDGYGLVPGVGPLPRGRLLFRFARLGPFSAGEPLWTFPMILRPVLGGGWEVESINVHGGGAGPDDS